MKTRADKIERLEYVWDNGVSTPAELSVEEIQEFKSRTSARRVIARKWFSDEWAYQTHHQVRLLQDRSGLVYYQNDDPQTGRLVVMNSDGTQRFTIGAPRIDANSRPEDGYLALPPSSAHFGGIEWGCEGNDGHTDYLFDFDWQTGALLRYARPTRPW
jgi:hypothetical protein